MKNILTMVAALVVLSGQAQQLEKFNLDFENQKENTELADDWFKWGSYSVTMDLDSYSGQKSGKVSSLGATGTFGSIAYRIPARYQGESIKLEGYLKVRNVENGFAGLLLRIDGDGEFLAFDNMEDQQIHGTSDWKEYSITLNYPKEAEIIYVGGVLVGKGEAWFDDFNLSIDGNDIRALEEVEKPLSRAELDKEFDDGSGIALSQLTSKEIKNLELLGKVWGFLKYHHPEIAKGNYNWDYELFRFLPIYLKTKNEKERNDLLIAWINDLGTVDKCSKCQSINEMAWIKPDLAWIKNQPETLRDKLLNIYENRNQGPHYYIKHGDGVGNPVFKNEDSYGDMPYPDDGFRLLALFRYWNAINYFFPYKHLMDVPWATKLTEYIPEFVNTEDELAYELTTLKLIADIQDTHAVLSAGADKVESWKGANYPPIHVRFVENQLVVMDYYNDELREEVGLSIGDIITKVNGISVEAIIKEKSDYYPASNKGALLREISADILRSNSESIEIEYKTDTEKEITASLKLYPLNSLNYYRRYKDITGPSYKLINNDIGYVTLQTIKAEDVAMVKDQFRNTKGIIVDIRNYPSAFVPFTLGSYFCSSQTPFVKFSISNRNNPGEFYFTGNRYIPATDEVYAGKLVVLVNELAQSSAEYTAMAFKAVDQSIIIGSTTAGADGNVSNIVLPGGLRTRISGIGVNYPDGGETQRIGIVPDIEVQPTIEGIRNGKDELLERAIEVILNE